MRKLLLLTILFISSAKTFGESIIIDGVLDEPEWDNAFSVNKFFQTSPFNLKETKDDTIVYIFSNQDGIYVGFFNKQSNSSMLSKKTLHTMKNEIILRQLIKSK